MQLICIPCRIFTTEKISSDKYFAFLSLLSSRLNLAKLPQWIGPSGGISTVLNISHLNTSNHSPQCHPNCKFSNKSSPVDATFLFYFLYKRYTNTLGGRSPGRGRRKTAFPWTWSWGGKPTPIHYSSTPGVPNRCNFQIMQSVNQSRNIPWSKELSYIKNYLYKFVYPCQSTHSLRLSTLSQRVYQYSLELYNYTVSNSSHCGHPPHGQQK